MKKVKVAALIARLLLGLVFLVFGLNGFFGFLPMPEMNPAGDAFLGALMGTGYLMTLVKAIEVIVGIALLAGCYVAFALVLLAPILVNIVLFHTFLEPQGAPMAYILLVIYAFLVWAHRNYYRPMFACKAEPSV